MSNNSIKKFVSEAQQVVNALQTPEFAGKTFVLGGKAIKAKDLAAILQAAIAAVTEGAAAQINYRASIVKQKAAKATAAAYMPEIKSYIAIMYGKTSTTYATFGFAAPQPVKATPAVKAAAVVKRNATRAARGTLGKRQRSRIKGGGAAAAPAASGSKAGTGSSS
jgi:hypothetical protein